jgi:predicted Zn finger-like uncharacterized protein
VIVQCPYCATRFHVEDARLKGVTPRFRCSRCRQIFAAPSGKAAPSKPVPAPPPQPPAAAAAPETLSLPFEEPSWKDEAESHPAGDFSDATGEEEFTLGPIEPPKEFDLPPVDDASDAGAAAAPAPEEALGAGDFDQQNADAAAEDLEDENEMVMRSGDGGAQSERGKMVVIMLFLALIVAGYAGFAAALIASPALGERVIGAINERVPVLGSVGSERLLTRKVALTDIAASYQRIKDDTEVFMITGRAINTSSVALHGVQILGRLYDGAGQEIERKTIYCGNAISTKVLKDLSPREVSVLQTLNPPSRFFIEPGQSATFVIVFLKPPPAAADFSAQVVSAQRHV